MIAIPSIKKLVFSFTLLAFISFGANAQGPKAPPSDTIQLVDLDKTLHDALAHNPNDAVYRKQIQQARYNYKGSESFFYPQVTAAFDGTDNLHLQTTPIPGVIFGRPGTTVYAQFGKKYVYNTGLTVNQDILNWSALLQKQIADRNITLAGQQRDAYIQSLKEQVAGLYFSAQVAQLALMINQQDQTLSDSILTLARNKLAEGLSDLQTVNKAAINANSIRQNQAQSRQLLEQSLENLKILLGTRPAIELRLADSLRLDTLTPSWPTVMATDRGLAVYRQQAGISALQSKAARANAYPRISFSAFLGDQQFRDDFGLTFARGDWNTYSYLGLNISVPLFTGLANHFKYKSAQVQQDIADLQLSTAIDQSAIRDRLLLKNYDSYLDMVRSSAASFRLYSQNLQLDQQKYQEGLISLDAYLRTFQDYLNAENTYLNSLSQWLSVKSTLISRQ